MRGALPLSYPAGLLEGSPTPTPLNAGEKSGALDEATVLVLLVDERELRMLVSGDVVGSSLVSP